MKRKPQRKASFKVWNESLKQWVGRMHFVVSSGGDILFWNAEKKQYYDAAPHYKLVESTGLKDKNGKMIYEGDILAIKFYHRWYERISWKGGPDCIAKVIWDYCGFRLAAKGKEDSRFADFHDEKGTYKLFEMSLKHTKVLGNIYENPELLP